LISKIELLTPWSVFDIATKEKEITRLEKESSVPEFWQDPSAAQATMRRLAEIKKEAEQWRGLEHKAADLGELSLLASEEASLLAELEIEVLELSNRLSELEFRLAFNGPYDSRNAILAVHAGAGGTESQDWADMLLRMYLHWAERHSYRAEILDQSVGEEAGIKSVVLEIEGSYTYGYLKSEHGVHRLIRLSPFDTDHARHTSFALVEVMPEAEGEVDVHIAPDDLKIDAFRSSGPGGQNVQKVSSAVRITHIPSGIAVTSQCERSQHQNKEAAMLILRARLFQVELAKRREERARLKGKRISAEWGSQIRSYTLHPYKLVKDHRTDFQSGNPDAVLGGDLDGFINAYLRSGLGQEND
jgi:peptide chain release factor 2